MGLTTSKLLTSSFGKLEAGEELSSSPIPTAFLAALSALFCIGLQSATLMARLCICGFSKKKHRITPCSPPSLILPNRQGSCPGFRASLLFQPPTALEVGWLWCFFSAFDFETFPFDSPSLLTWPQSRRRGENPPCSSVRGK